MPRSAVVALRCESKRYFDLGREGHEANNFTALQPFYYCVPPADKGEDDIDRSDSENLRLTDRCFKNVPHVANAHFLHLRVKSEIRF
jgi:hypothetical protein